ncbi:UDP-3-O-(3-hydroxymyristoyl)glucosamine N-acyltransferase [Cognatishimia sp. F0-27]|uniref:UDP-3-O-(3-hydroxymyristoyl)glucosamine N-acyltransferase n=1 Tax=Cognatishimia sp. F0-27 TaxID=2816855 RepID=UPI001D0CD351|nr:UDP-3-O-(3-hydroxymyristoyl)glucosamine N-acyltransferase [Cognatishimia sp. F0-27]MCC1492366.1 UDP-3-O-(3-hydroxymyristoyl)glucosamine N-acyltransferase [Cognatishimia sp. F0-27]
MSHTIGEIARALGLPVQGQADLPIVRVAEPAMAGPEDIALAMRPKYAEALASGQARAAMLWEGADWQSYGLAAAILAPRPRFTMAALTEMMDPGQGYGTGAIHPSAVIDESAEIGAGVSIGPLCVIGPGAQIGAHSVVGPQCHIGLEARIGCNALLHSGVRIGARVRIGERVIAHPGATIGADGFSFVTAEPSGVERARATLGGAGTDAAQPWSRIHSLGGVDIGDDVEIGANSCIDRGTVRDTVIGAGCKFDNLVQIGHNVQIGRDCLICAQVGVAGSTVIGNNVVLGGQSGVSDNLIVGDRAILGGATVVLSNVPEGRVMLGYPAVKMETHIETYKGLRRLPRLFRDVGDLKKAVSKLTGND